MVAERTVLGFWACAVVLLLALSVGAAILPIQITLVALGVIMALFLARRSSVITVVVLMVPTLSLVRRIAAGKSAYLEADPLILLPILLAVGVVAVSLTRERTDRGVSYNRVLSIAIILGVFAAVVLRGALSINALFFAALIVVPLLLAITLSSGRLTDVWKPVSRILPWLGVATGVYGLVQFFVLPPWDRAWMISSELTSIGHPYPLQVRVFGASESPGPYAIMLGLSLTASLCAATLTKGAWKKFGWVIVSAVIAVPLVLTGVRSALFAVAICVALLAITRAKGFARILLVAFLIGVYQLLTLVIGQFGAGSTILTTDRYSDFATDDSLIARLGLLNYLQNPFQFVIGDPNAVSVDNLYIDVLVRYGLVPSLGLLLLFVSVAVRAFKLLRRHTNEVASLCVWFLITQSLFGNIFNSLVGLLIGVILGAVMSAPSDRHSELSAERRRDTALSS